MKILAISHEIAIRKKRPFRTHGEVVLSFSVATFLLQGNTLKSSTDNFYAGGNMIFYISESLTEI